jgi:2-haloalkanoic acid dehalogenase type II
MKLSAADRRRRVLEGVRALSFDCYGTLVDWERGLTELFAWWSADHGLDADAEELLPLFARFESEHQGTSPTSPYRRILERVMTSLAAELGVDLAAGEEAALADSLPRWPLFPDTVDFLRRARKTYLLAVISNVDDDLFAATRERLEVDLDVVVTAQSVGAYKPSPAGFHRCLELLQQRGIGREQVLHVAQSLYHDHLPAKRLGLRTCWVDRRAGKAGFGATSPPDEDVRPDLRVESLAELAAMV